MTQVPVVEVGILTPDAQLARFTLTFYGVDYSEFLVSPGGGTRIREALERRGLFGYGASPFFIRRVYYLAATPRRRPPPPVEPPIEPPLPLPTPDRVAIGAVGRRRRRRSWGAP